MTAVLLGAGWAGVVLLATARHRPPPPRARALVAAAAASGGRVRPARPDLLGTLGAAVLRRLPTGATRPPAGATPPSTRAVGATTVATAAALVVAPLLAPVVVVIGAALPRHRAAAAERRRLRALEAALPDMVDLVVLAVGAGCNVPLALAAAGRRGSGPLADEVRRVSAEVDRGRRLADALDDLPVRAGEPVRAMAAVLAGCERYGTPVLPALHRLADEVRVQRQRRAEAAARRVPVTLLFPLVVCILPAFALLTVAPLVAGALRELRL